MDSKIEFKNLSRGLKIVIILSVIGSLLIIMNFFFLFLAGFILALSGGSI